MSEAQPDAIKQLVKFILCLAILGTILALAWYLAVALPVQHAVLVAPVNIAR
jgi:hypothetical protein